MDAHKNGIFNLYGTLDDEHKMEYKTFLLGRIKDLEEQQLYIVCDKLRELYGELDVLKPQAEPQDAWIRARPIRCAFSAGPPPLGPFIREAVKGYRNEHDKKLSPLEKRKKAKKDIKHRMMLYEDAKKEREGGERLTIEGEFDIVKDKFDKEDPFWL
jgi:hypothetical protein